MCRVGHGLQPGGDEGVRQPGLVDDLDRRAVAGLPDRAVMGSVDLHGSLRRSRPAVQDGGAGCCAQPSTSRYKNTGTSDSTSRTAMQRLTARIAHGDFKTPAINVPNAAQNANDRNAATTNPPPISRPYMQAPPSAAVW